MLYKNKKKISISVIMFLIGFLATLGNKAYAQERGEAKKTIGFLGIWDRATPLIERAARENNISISFFKMDDAIKGNQIEQVSILYLLNLEPSLIGQLKDKVEKLKKDNPNLKVIALAPRDGQAALKNAGLLDKDENITPYWRANGLVNMRRLLNYTNIVYLGGKGEIEPAVAVPDYGYFHPKSQDILNLESLKKLVSWKEDAPTAALLIQQSFWITQDTKVIEAQILALEKEGFNVATAFADTTERMKNILLEIKPNIIIEDRHGSIWEGVGKETLLSQLDVPYLRPISMLGYTIEDWLKDPRGLHVRDVGNFLTIQESRGTIEPLVIGGLKENIQGFRLHEAIPERIERFAKRASVWVQLQKKKNIEKKIAIIYYSKSLGKDDLMRGSPTGAFLDAPESLFRFLPRLKKEGYDINKLPTSTKELLEWSMKRARNIGPWAQGDLEEMADQPGAVLVPLTQYEEWFNSKLSEKCKQEVIKNFGPPPGKFMVVTRNEKPYIVVPAVQFGNVILAPQPERGEKQDEKLLHSRDVPPPHNYLAFYWWMQESFGADAILHWGTHGSLELLPGKEAGLSKDDWSDICIGKMLVINPWIMDNLGEATLSRRRSYAVLTDHMVPPAVNSGLTDELQVIHDDIEKFDVLEQGLLREKFRKQITEGSAKSRLDTTVDIKYLKDRLLTDEEIVRVHDYLHELYSATTPMTLHVLGMPPEQKYMVPYLVTVLRRSFLDRLTELFPVPKEDGKVERAKYAWLRTQAEKLVEETVIGENKPPTLFEKDIVFAKDMHTKLLDADREITSILHALSGGYIMPGPGPDPVKNPSSIPAGRNLYALNPEEIPTKASWEVAKQLVNEVLAKKLPKKVGIDLNGMNTMRDFGINEAQILYFMGVQPIWDANGLVNDVELISQEVLKRPRIDVFVAMGGQYKENFPTRVKLLDKAVRLVSAIEDKDNRVRQGSQHIRNKLLEKGFSKEKAEQLSLARIFGTKPGNMSGTKILDLVPRSGVWSSDDEITSVYIDSMSYVYTGDVWGEKIEGVYEEAIQNTDTLIRVWASNMTSELSNHHAYEYLGGLNMAVKKLTGNEPEALIADVRDPEGAKMRQFEEVLATNLRSELLNRKWIQGMKDHDYAGAGHIAELVKNTFGWSVTRSSSVENGVWDDIRDIYTKDKYEMGLRDWFEKVNPHALQELTATMLEASRKGYWKTDQKTIDELSKLYAELVTKHGMSAGLVSGGNAKLEETVIKNLGSKNIDLAKQFKSQVEKSSGAPSAAKVQGAKMEAVKEAVDKKTAQKAEEDVKDYWLFYVLGFVLLVFLIGIFKRSGEPS